MRRIMGTEVEYGIAVPGDATANPVLTSTQVVLAYAAAADIPRARTGPLGLRGRVAPA